MTLMFHKVVWQHMQGVVGVLLTTLLQIYKKIFREKFWKSVKIWQNYGHEFVASFLLANRVVSLQPVKSWRWRAWPMNASWCVV